MVDHPITDITTNIEETLAELWFGQRNPCEPIYLGLEEELLTACGVNPLQIISEISRQTLEDIDRNKPKDIFYSLKKRTSKWKSGNRKNPPPILSIIGASVLAAQNMDGDRDHSANAYYPRLAAVLEYKVSSAQLSACYDDVVFMWETLHEWIEQNPTLGPSMISSLGGHARIGFARSQAMVTARDRQILSKIKTKIGPEVFARSSDSDLLEELKVWSSRNSGPHFSAAFRASVDGADKEIQSFLIQATKSAPFMDLEESPRSSHVVQAEIWYDFNSQEFSWVVPKKEHLAGFIGTDSQGNEIRIEDSFLSEIWMVRAMPLVSEESLSTDHFWKSENCSVMTSSRKYWVFQDVSSSDSVMSTKNAVDADRFSLLVPSSRIKNLAAKHALDLSSLNHYPNVFNGWDFYADISCSEQPELLHLVNSLNSVSKDKENSSQFELQGGLAIRSLSKSKGYLEGFEPDLMVERSVGSYSLVLNGNRAQNEFQATGHPLPISKFSFGPGIRTLEVPDIWNEKYQVLSASQAWKFSRIENDPGSVEVLKLDDKYLARRDRYYFIISERGKVDDVTYWGQPTWIRLRENIANSHRYLTDFQNFVISVPRDCVWLVGLHETRRPIVTRIHEREITFDHESVMESADVWRAFLDLVPTNGIDELSSLLGMVKGICK